MRRPVVHFLLTLVAAASILGVVPATSDAGILPWTWDTLSAPVGSIPVQTATYSTYYNGGYGGGYDAGCSTCGGYSSGAYYGPAVPMFVGFRGWRRACCGNQGYGGYASYGYGGCGCSPCGASCGTGCSPCGGGCDGGYGCSTGSCGVGGCASGQCNVNYGANPGASGNASPVTPAAPPAGGPTPGYDNGGASGSNVVPPPAPGAAATDGFVPRTDKAPAPGTADPTKEEEYVPPKVITPQSPNGATDANGNSTTVPPVEPNPVTPRKKPSITDEDDKETNVGPRLELEEKVTWHREFVRTRQALAPARVTASAVRHGLFQKSAWRATVDTELAKK